VDGRGSVTYMASMKSIWKMCLFFRSMVKTKKWMSKFFIIWINVTIAY